MCMQCVGAVATAFNAAIIVGGPIAAQHWQRVRAAFGLEDNSVAAVEARDLERARAASSARAEPARDGSFGQPTEEPKPCITSVAARRPPAPAVCSASPRS